MINLHKLKSKNSTKSITLTLCFNLIIFTINPRKLKNSRNNRIVNNKLKAMDLKKKKSYKKHERTTIFHETKKKKKRRIKTIIAIRQFTYYLQLETNFYVHMSNNPPRFDYVTRQMHQGCESEAA